MTVKKAKDRLLYVAIKYGYSMTRTGADEHRPKDLPFRMSLARAYITYERACKRAKKAP